MKTVLGKVNPHQTPQTISHFVYKIIEVIENGSDEDFQVAVDFLQRNLPKELSFLIDRFGTIQNIFSLRKPEIIANQIIEATGKNPFNDCGTGSIDSYVALIIDNLFSLEVEGGGSAAVVEAPLSEADLPAHWQDMEGGYALVEVDLGSREVAGLVAAWNIPSPIVGVLRVQNRNLWRRFRLQRSIILESVGENDLNERHLWHGTSRVAADSISLEGFDHRVGRTNGRVWGDGIYLSSHADYALAYANPDYGDLMQSFNRTQYSRANVAPPTYLAHLRPVQNNAGPSTAPKFQRDGEEEEEEDWAGCVIYARAVCGKSTIGNGSLKRPPPIDQKDQSKGLFNSCTNYDGDMFVIFERSQTYPEYIVNFELTDPFQEG